MQISGVALASIIGIALNLILPEKSAAELNDSNDKKDRKRKIG